MSIPISLYTHIPWCIQKCPYCDFNSHPKRGELPEKAYIDRLLQDLNPKLHTLQHRPLHSIFIGGGTPSLFSPESYERFFTALKQRMDMPNAIEITLEVNPGTVIPNRFDGYREVGINRLSLGVQSFQNDKLKALGRIHNTDQASAAVEAAKKAGFDNFNIDLMFGLPDQSIEDALFDLQTAIDLAPTHISWYQLTLEPNTYFYRFPPVLPTDDEKFEMQTAGQQLLAQHGYAQYEVSAYAKNNRQCQQNLNYWLFGDYIGIGAGAHGKTTDLKNKAITRHSNTKHPTQYMTAETITDYQSVKTSEIALEFMMNALRLHRPIGFDLFEARTGLASEAIAKPLKKAIEMGLLIVTNDTFSLTSHGKLFLNDVLALF